mmetsp:Transcript_21332/g.31365  ORF Transcript_21332/g.31365 Transcript_21332/m.31365 type:complete len:84 (+) Transcript_21332:1240-1491(+)
MQKKILKNLVKLLRIRKTRETIQSIAGKSQKEIHEVVVIENNVAKKRGKAKIRCAKINPLAFIDIITDAWEKCENDVATFFNL